MNIYTWMFLDLAYKNALLLKLKSWSDQ